MDTSELNIKFLLTSLWVIGTVRIALRIVWMSNQGKSWSLFGKYWSRSWPGCAATCSLNDVI